jgi:hypothetical protein
MVIKLKLRLSEAEADELERLEESDEKVKILKN